ncbi:alginate export family protein [Alcanivorax marinus]|uniref:Alginate export family protein n=1 Tax=Alloalcanivorax marinus TaxID=1177169 RepID=A0A9Q3UKS3_9GAMM|nr:alginate export family protein [Alloalcanivorax marinus]MCC4309051.1 alginate export family protein [Alloalcanivorax marinus]
MITAYSKAVKRALLACSLTALGAHSQALELVANDQTRLDLTIEGVGGVFHSQENYATAGSKSEGSSSWQEGYLKYGLALEQQLGGGQLFGAVNALSSGTWDDGDAAGFSDGSERETDVEDAYLGWRSGDLFPALGENGLAFSAGRQAIKIGDGFLISGDALNFGNGIAGGDLNRGGAYYLAARQAFDKTAVLSLGGDSGWRGDAMWIESDNPAQAEAAMQVGNLEHVGDAGTFGLTYIKVDDVEEDFAFLYPQRDGEETWSLRYQGDAGVDNLFLSGEYAWQDQDQGDEDAWYLEAGWTFADAPWQPSVHYRYSRFSEGFDPLFYGNGRSLGTWFQGEVAANYAGPFNTNTKVHNIALGATPRENLSIGLLAYDFATLDQDAGVNLDAREFDLYAEWGVTANLAIIPLIGLYQPDASADDGGTQLGGDDDNLYTQLIVAFGF